MVFNIEGQKELIDTKYNLKIKLEELTHKNIMEEIKLAGKLKVNQRQRY